MITFSLASPEGNPVMLHRDLLWDQLRVGNRDCTIFHVTLWDTDEKPLPQRVDVLWHNQVISIAGYGETVWGKCPSVAETDILNALRQWRDSGVMPTESAQMIHGVYAQIAPMLEAVRTIGQMTTPAHLARLALLASALHTLADHNADPLPAHRALLACNAPETMNAHATIQTASARDLARWCDTVGDAISLAYCANHP